MTASTSELCDPSGVARFLKATEPIVIKPLGEGHSNFTFLVECDGDRFVLRRPPRGEIHAGTHEMWREFQCLTALQDSDVPVPRPIALCEDPTFIGSPFFLMELVDGVVARREFPAALKGHAFGAGISLATTLAKIHNFDYRVAVLERLVRKPEEFLVRNIRRMNELLDMIRHRDVPEIDELGQWIARNTPTQRDITLTHGDYKLDNVILAPQPPSRVAAVVDWEIASVGDPLVDVGWMLYFHAASTDEVFWHEGAATKAEGYPPRHHVVEVYAKASGRTVDNLSFYAALAGWKIAIIMEGSYRRHIEGMADDPMFETLGPAVGSLARRGLQFARGELEI